MSAENRITIATYSATGRTMTNSVYQHSYGQILRLEGFENLPDPFEIHFSAQINGEAIPRIGTDGAVAIPDELVEQRQPIFAWLFLHDTEDDGETVYTIEIPIKARAKMVNREPTTVEQDVISQAIGALHDATTRSEAAADRAEQAANAAGYVSFEINEDGDLIYTRTENVDIDFALDENGDLIMTEI